MHYSTILFDLDGTLTDPGLGITNAVIYALKKYHIDVTDRSELYRFIGPPLHDSFVNFYDFSSEEAYKAIEYYREYYKDKGIFENSVYEGIEPLLKQLVASGKTLVVATSKPEVFAKRIMEHFGLSHYFTFIGGSELDGTRVKKSEVIAYALQSCDITDLSQVVMIGDREHDILGAKAIGIDSIGVLFGYGDPTEHEKAGATYIVDNVASLESLLLDSPLNQEASHCL